jgi:hypothetical protein
MASGVYFGRRCEKCCRNRRFTIRGDRLPLASDELEAMIIFSDFVGWKRWVPRLPCERSGTANGGYLLRARISLKRGRRLCSIARQLTRVTRDKMAISPWHRIKDARAAAATQLDSCDMSRKDLSVEQAEAGPPWALGAGLNWPKQALMDSQRRQHRHEERCRTCASTIRVSVSIKLVAH